MGPRRMWRGISIPICIESFHGAMNDLIGMATLFLISFFLEMGPTNGKTPLYLCFGIFVSWGQKRKGHRFTHCLAFFSWGHRRIGWPWGMNGDNNFPVFLVFCGQRKFFRDNPFTYCFVLFRGAIRKYWWAQPKLEWTIPFLVALPFLWGQDKFKKKQRFWLLFCLFLVWNMFLEKQPFY